MNKVHILAFFILITVSFSSCKSKKSPTTSKIKGLDQVNFHYFSSKLKIDYNDGSQSIGLNATLRMKKDEVVWMTVIGPFGVKVGKLKLTPDSIHILQDYPEKTVQEYDIKQFNQKNGTELSVTQVQNLLLGNLLFSDKSKVTTENERMVIKQSSGGFDIINILEGNKIKEVSVSSTIQQGSVQLIYNDFQKHQDNIIPEKANLTLSHPSLSADVAMQHKNINFTNEELDFSFSVSDKYVRK